MSGTKISWIARYDELMMQYCRPFISDAELNASIRIVCKEIDSRYSTALSDTEVYSIVSGVLDDLVKSKRISSRAAQIFKDQVKLVFLCCTNVYGALRSERFKDHTAHLLELSKV
jgi:hypothetical protein